MSYRIGSISNTMGSSNYTQESSASSSAHNEPSEQDVADFERLMKQSKQDKNQNPNNFMQDKQSGSGLYQSLNNANGAHNKLSQGSTIEATKLTDMFSDLMSSWQGNGVLQQNNAQNMGQNVAVNQAQTEGLIDREQMQQLANKVLDRIQVSIPQLNQTPEVRLTLGAALADLSGTQIILQREANGSLAVMISCQAPDQVKKLSTMAEEIKMGLEDLEDRYVEVKVLAPESENQSSTDSAASFNSNPYDVFNSSAFKYRM